jgi:copper oxidase (laccase) domain-containing protein
MKAEFGSKPSAMMAAIGPGIGQCCFEVGEEVRQLFRSRFAYADELFDDGTRPRMDLVEANRRQLMNSGLALDAVFNLSECTSCGVQRYFSYRAERGKTGRLMAAIGIAADFGD